MGSRLKHSSNWKELAHESGYNVRRLARLCEVSMRQLERFLQANLGKTPHELLHEVRMQRAVELICDRTSAKETALTLHYKSYAHFSRDFKRTYGVCPSQYCERVATVSL